MFEAEDGQVLLADWALGTALSEATAAQLGFAYDPEQLPFCGRKGRTRLAVVDGLLKRGGRAPAAAAQVAAPEQAAVEA